MGIRVLALQWWRRALARPLYAALLTATAIWLAGTLAHTMHSDRAVKLPDLTLDSLDGGQANLAVFAGKPTVINL